MAAKCNITKLALDSLLQLQYSVRCSKSNVKNLLENYIEYLNCSDVNLTVCEPSICINDVVSFSCKLRVIALDFVVEDQLLVFSIPSGGIIGASGELTYNWEYDANSFNIVGAMNTEQLILTLKEGKLLSNVVAPIKVTVSDANGCVSEKQCYVAGGVTRCNINYTPCSTPMALTLTNKIVNCARPLGLVVTKKL